jgi:hypothetical protein
VTGTPAWTDAGPACYNGGSGGRRGAAPLERQELPMNWRNGVSLTLAAIALAAPARGADVDARAVVEKALQASGGAEKLAKLKAVVVTAKGTIAFPGAEVNAAREDQFRLPGRWRRSVKLESDMVKGEILITLAPEGGWRRFVGPAAELTVPELTPLREEAHAFWLGTLLPLADKDASLTVTLLPETKADAVPSYGLKVAKAGQPDVLMYFDKKSGLLVKTEFKAREVGKPVLKEFIFSEHRDFNGLKLPTKQADFIEGKRNGSWEGISYRFPEKIEEAVFGRP